MTSISINMGIERRFGMGKLQFDRYLPNTEARLERLGEVIAERPLAILLPGPSIYQLEKSFLGLQNSNICYATVNDFWIFEEEILSQNDLTFDVILASATECNIPTAEHIEYLGRGKDNVFLSTKVAWGEALNKYLPEFDSKLLFFETDPPPNVRVIPSVEEPLTFRPLASFALLLLICIIGGAEEIYLFGADGGQYSDNQLYYRTWPSQSWGRFMMDTRILNENFPIILKRVCDLYRIKQPKIYNVSTKSNYECFRKISYADAFDSLR